LLDGDGHVAALYKGPVSHQQLLADRQLLDASPHEQRAAAVPFPGRWATTPLPPMPLQVIGTMMKSGHKDSARAYTQRCLDPQTRLAISDEVHADLILFLGDLSLDEGDFDEAVRIYARLFEIAPDNAVVHRKIGMRLVSKQQIRAAIGHLETAVSASETDVDARLNLAMLYVRQERLADATSHFRVLVEQRPEVAGVHFYLASALHRQGLTREALPHYRRAQVLEPDSPASNDLAWILATHSDPAVRDGAEAVKLAEQLCQGTDFQNPLFLHTLGAAYAEQGQFERAISTIEKAIQIAKPAMAQGFQTDLKRLRAGLPIRD
jgi:tetratricopeptide (TPR) repeat protein